MLNGFMDGCTLIWLSVHGGVVRDEERITSRHAASYVVACNARRVGGEDTRSRARFTLFFLFASMCHRGILVFGSSV